MKDFEIRPYSYGDEEEIVELLDIAFNGWPNFDVPCSSLEHWTWKHLENPQGSSFIVTVFKNSEMVASLHAYPIVVKVNDRFLSCTYAADNAVLPDYRGAGISNRMYEEIIDRKNKAGILFDYFVTSIPYLVKSWSKRFYTFPHPISNLVWIRDIGYQLREMPINHPWLVKGGFHFLKTLNKLRGQLTSKDKEDDIIIEEVDEFEERIDRFWNQISKNFDFIVERNRGYLNWRYCDPRAGKLVVKQLKRGDEVIGYIVLGINNRKKRYPVGYILDLLILPNELLTASTLIEDGLEFFIDKKVNLVNCLLPKNHPCENLLKNCGFLDSRINLKLFLRINPKNTYIGDWIKGLNSDRVHFTYGDIDSMPSEKPSYI